MNKCNFYEGRDSGTDEAFYCQQKITHIIYIPRDDYFVPRCEKHALLELNYQKVEYLKVITQFEQYVQDLRIIPFEK